ncbi:hypothetical protein [Clostridium chromiireducens]|uniref:Uncharacterized protein n=1 Tax=Clostridium chromiireducens TaxID=225345 RepID=A0A1V4IKU0_9CLOT|nr:hypothetical protein [Clostridium chromiireducens]MVX65344.1 hypothetical protein [Clostridium chromiireducens]OPJ60513.1 hypothetical protein CLCHR_28600 [Clostridium chromiireducens]
MHRGTAGFLGGVIAGLIKLAIDQIAVSINISSSSMIYIISRILFVTSGIYSFISYIIYILFTGLLGWIISKIITGILVNFLYWGTVAGITIWALMSSIFLLLGTIDPTWSINFGTTVINFFSHIVLGVIITYAISISRTEVNH